MVLLLQSTISELNGCHIHPLPNPITERERERERERELYTLGILIIRDVFSNIKEY
jgi:hypothetical protein